MSVGQRLLDVPFSEMVYNLAFAIAESQHKLDLSSIDILKIMGDRTNYPVNLPAIKLDSDGTFVNNEEDNITTSMIGAGFQPTFYQFAETVIEVQMTVSLMNETQSERKESGRETTVSGRIGFPWNRKSTLSIRSTPIDATYSSSYNFAQEGSSTIRTRLVPVPPNPFIQRLLEMKAQAMQDDFEVKLREIEISIEKAQEETRQKLEEIE